MSDHSAPRRRPAHLWIAGILSVLWNAMGIVDFTATNLKVEGYLKQFTPEQLAYVAAIPAWATVAWGLGTWGAFAGSLGLLLRRRWAVGAFAISLAGLAGSTLYQFVLSDPASGMRSGGAAIFTAVIWVVAILLLLYARAQAKRGVLV